MPRRTTTSVMLATALGSLVGTALAAAPAQAATVGQVDAQDGLVGHYVPAKSAPKYGSYGDGDRLKLVCKVHSETVKGNDLWYLVKGSKRRWVSARYVDNVGKAPRLCGDGALSRARTTARLKRREAPTLRADRVGTLDEGARVKVSCWVDGLGEGEGDVRWYQLANGTWVSADYVGSTTRRVEICA